MNDKYYFPEIFLVGKPLLNLNLNHFTFYILPYFSLIVNLLLI